MVAAVFKEQFILRELVDEVVQMEIVFFGSGRESVPVIQKVMNILAKC